MGPSITEPHIDGNNFVARDGVRLPITVWGPRDQPKTIVIALHSFGEFRDAYAPIGQHLAERDIAVWAYDQRGFGDGPHRGIWSGKETMVQDFQDFVLAVKESSNSAQIVILGESMGAAVALAGLSTSDTIKPSAVILSGPGVREDRPWRYWFNVGLWFATRIVPGYEAEVPRTYDSRLDDFHATRWANDPKIIDRVRLDTYYGLIQLSDWASEAAENIQAPTLVLFGTEDSQIHPRSICALMKRLTPNGELQVFKGQPHLMFQVEDQQAILSLIDSWIAEPSKSARAGSTLSCDS